GKRRRRPPPFYREWNFAASLSEGGSFVVEEKASTCEDQISRCRSFPSSRKPVLDQLRAPYFRSAPPAIRVCVIWATNTDCCPGSGRRSIGSRSIRPSISSP